MGRKLQSHPNWYKHVRMLFSFLNQTGIWSKPRVTKRNPGVLPSSEWPQCCNLEMRTGSGQLCSKNTPFPLMPRTGEIHPVPALRIEAWILDRRPTFTCREQSERNAKPWAPGCCPQERAPDHGLPYLLRRPGMADPPQPTGRVLGAPRHPDGLPQSHLHVPGLSWASDPPGSVATWQHLRGSALSPATTWRAGLGKIPSCCFAEMEGN